MSNIDWFNFEDKDLDFPFYKKNPHVPKWGWIVLFILMIIGLFLSMGSKIHLTIISCIIVVVPVLYFLKWDYKAIFQKLSRKDVALAFALFIGYIIYINIMDSVLGMFGLVPANLGGQQITVMTFLSLPFSLMTEEIIKFIPFMFFLRVVYKYSENRKLSIILSMIVTMIFFAFLHGFTLKLFLFTIWIQGLGSIFEFIGYIKTKNILVSYLTHIFSDLFIYSIAILGPLLLP